MFFSNLFKFKNISVLKEPIANTQKIVNNSGDKPIISPTEKPIENLAESEFPKNELRRSIAARYLVGEGIEIGALNAPLEVPNHVKIKYLDRMTVAELRQQYPRLADSPLVEVDIIDDGEKLASIGDDSLDFVIANHAIEHCEDAITSLENWLRVLKSEGILYLAVPDKRYTFDRDRPITPLQHLICDREKGTNWSRRAHFEEWVKLVEKFPEAEARIKYRMDMNFSIHFHVWTQIEFLEFILYCRRNLSYPFEIEFMQKEGVEFIMILRKTNK